MTAYIIQDEFTKLPTIQARYRARQKVRGLCLACSNKATGVFCVEHRQKHREYMRGYRKSNKSCNTSQK